MENDRRKFLKTSALIGLGGLAAKAFGTTNFDKLQEISESIQEVTAEPVVFKLPELGYAYSALEPFIDAKTMEIHHSKHHKAYVDNLNKALEGKNNTQTIEELLKTVSKQEKVIRNNGGGHYNHSLFWQMLSPNPETKESKPEGKLATAINASFGSFDEFKKQFTGASMSRFGSGWSWLYAEDKKLKIGSTANQDNPIMDNAEIKGSPILALDVWEHAYYLKYQNKRADYVSAWWNIVNWKKAEELFTAI
jgi:Fe-Mn family superoxide dismutase